MIKIKPPSNLTRALSSMYYNMGIKCKSKGKKGIENSPDQSDDGGRGKRARISLIKVDH